jgi:hypothetical protein
MGLVRVVFCCHPPSVLKTVVYITNVCEGDANAGTKHHCLLLLGYTLKAVPIIVNGSLKVGTETVNPEILDHQHMP